MRVLLTGAAGFIGGHILSRLRTGGYDVVAVDHMLSSAHGADADPPDGVIAADVRDIDTLRNLLARVDVVCHQAAVVGSGIDAADAPAFASHNDYGTAVLLAAMAETGCRRLVLASSMVVYGDGSYRCDVHGDVRPAPRTLTDLESGRFDVRCPVGGEVVSWQLVDEDAPLRPRSLYAASKLAQENYALAWAEASDASVVALRYHNVYGDHMPRDTPYSGVAAIFRSALESGHAPQVFEDGRQARDFVHVSDVATANMAAIESSLDGFTAVNVCSGRPITIGEVAQELGRARGGPAPVVTGAFRAGDVRHVVADPRRAESVLGFRARIDPATGLRAFSSAPLRQVAGTSRPVP